MTRQKRREMPGDTDRADTRAAAAVGDAEGLVQIEMADVGADVAGTAQADLRVHVGAVHVDLPARGVHELAHLGDRRFKDAVRRRVRDHHRREPVFVLSDLLLQISDVDVAFVVAFDDDDFEAGHHRRRRIRAVRRLRNQTDATMGFTARVVKRADDEHAGVLALAARVWLQADGGEAGDLTQAAFEFVKDDAVARRVVDGGEGVQTAKRTPGHGHHLGGRVELHRARAQGDHAVHEAVILLLQRKNVAQHLGLALARAKHRMRQKRRRPRNPRGPVLLRCRRRRGAFVGAGEQGDQRLHIVIAGGFVEGDAERGRIEIAQRDAGGAGANPDGLDHFGGAAAAVAAFCRRHRKGVEEDIVLDRKARGAQPIGQHPCAPVDLAGDFCEPFGPVPHGVHRGHDRQQRLGSADVARRFFTTDVLLARLQRHAQSRSSLHVFRHADQATRHRTRVRFLRRHERRVRTAVAHRHTEALGAADDDVGALLARRGDQTQGQRIGGDDGKGVFGVRRRDESGEVADAAGGARILHEDGADAGVVGEGVDVVDDDLDLQRLHPRLHDGDGLRVGVFTDKDLLRPGLTAQAQGHREGFGDGGAFVEQARIGDLHAREVDDHRLVVEQRLEAALGNLGLIGRVGRVPGGILEDVSLDDAGDNDVAVAHAQVRFRRLVLRGDRRQLVEQIGF